MFSADKHVFDFRNNRVTTRNKCDLLASYKWKSSPIYHQDTKTTKTFITIIVIGATNSYCSFGCRWRPFNGVFWNWLFSLPAEDEISQRS